MRARLESKFSTKDDEIVIIILFAYYARVVFSVRFQPLLKRLVRAASLIFYEKNKKLRIRSVHSSHFCRDTALHQRRLAGDAQLRLDAKQRDID